MNIKKNDEVVVVSGDDKGHRGKVLRSFPKENTVLVQGINIVKKTIKKDQEHPNGGFIEKEMPVDVSNVMLFDPKVNKPVRTKVVVDANGNKKRQSVKSDHVFE